MMRGPPLGLHNAQLTAACPIPYSEQNSKNCFSHELNNSKTLDQFNVKLLCESSITVPGDLAVVKIISWTRRILSHNIPMCDGKELDHTVFEVLLSFFLPWFLDLYSIPKLMQFIWGSCSRDFTLGNAITAVSDHILGTYHLYLLDFAANIYDCLPEAFI